MGAPPRDHVSRRCRVSGVLTNPELVCPLLRGGGEPIRYHRDQRATRRRGPMGNRSPGSRWTAAAVSTVVLLVASILPSPLRRRPGWKWLGPDKLLHLVGHAGYAVTLANAFGAGRRTDGEAAVLAVCVSTTHSLVTGRLQKRVPGRMSESMDVLAGLVGAILTAFSWYAVRRYRTDRTTTSGRPEKQ